MQPWKFGSTLPESCQASITIHRPQIWYLQALARPSENQQSHFFPAGPALTVMTANVFSARIWISTTQMCEVMLVWKNLSVFLLEMEDLARLFSSLFLYGSWNWHGLYSCNVGGMARHVCKHHGPEAGNKEDSPPHSSLMPSFDLIYELWPTTSKVQRFSFVCLKSKSRYGASL
jgi:hypothetical protein